MENIISDDGESAIERTQRLLNNCKPCCVLITRSSYIEQIMEEEKSDYEIMDEPTETPLGSQTCDQEDLKEPILETPFCDQEDLKEPILETPFCDQEDLDEPNLNAPFCDQEDLEEPCLETPLCGQEISEDPILKTPISEQEILDEPTESPLGNQACDQDLEEAILETPFCVQEILEDPALKTPISEQEILDEPLETSSHQSNQLVSQQISQQLISEQSISQPRISPHKIISEVGSMKNPYAISKKSTVYRQNLLDQPFSIYKFVKNQEVGSVKNPFASYRHPSVSIDELTLLYFQAISGVLFNNNEKEEDDVDNFINGLIEQATFSENEFLSLLDSLDSGLPNACKNV